MDPRSQPRVLAMLTQVEEMLIACTSPILYAMHSICEQYKYRGHTISFPWEVKYVSMTSPKHIKYIKGFAK